LRPRIHGPRSAIAAVDLATGAKRWESPLGATTIERDGKPATVPGSLNLGGPLVTAGGHGKAKTKQGDFVVAYSLP